jgi:hypothetical protein
MTNEAFLIAGRLLLSARTMRTALLRKQKAPLGEAGLFNFFGLERKA